MSHPDCRRSAQPSSSQLLLLAEVLVASEGGGANNEHKVVQFYARLCERPYAPPSLSVVVLSLDIGPLLAKPWRHLRLCVSVYSWLCIMCCKCV